MDPSFRSSVNIKLEDTTLNTIDHISTDFVVFENTENNSTNNNKGNRPSFIEFYENLGIHFIFILYFEILSFFLLMNKLENESELKWPSKDFHLQKIESVNILKKEYEVRNQI